MVYNSKDLARASEMGAFLELEERLPAGFHVFEFWREPCPENWTDDTSVSFRCGERFRIGAMDIDTQISVRLDDLTRLKIPLVKSPT